MYLFLCYVNGYEDEVMDIDPVVNDGDEAMGIWVMVFGPCSSSAIGGGRVEAEVCHGEGFQV